MRKILEKIKTVHLYGDTLLSLSSKAIAMVLFLCTDIAIARLLENDGYGEWSFFYSIVSMCFWVVWFGVNSSTKVYVARESECRKRQSSCIVVGLQLRIVFSFIFLLVLLLVGQLAASSLGYPEKYSHLKTLFFIGGFLCFFNSFSEFFKDLYIGLVNFKNIFFMSIIEFGSNLFLGVGLLLFTKSVLGLAWGYVFAALFTCSFGFIALHFYFKKNGKKRAGKAYEKEMRSKIFKYALPILALSFGALILTEMDVFMLGIMNTPTETGLYSIAKSLVSKATHINLAICTSTMTAFAIITPENSAEKKQLYNKIMLTNGLLSILISALLFIFGPFAIQLLYGAQYQEAGIVLRALVPYYFIFSVSVFIGTFLDYQGKAKQRMASYFVMVALNLVLNYLFIPAYGATGAAIATCISMVPYLVSTALSAQKVFRSYKKSKAINPQGKRG
ncbi:flippase [Ruminococcaceae bacterium OttesenSCG-928-A16]|nr:flippase [Ruminococcaceae bacterium OttesenSCG-928-A16]